MHTQMDQTLVEHQQTVISTILTLLEQDATFQEALITSPEHALKQAGIWDLYQMLDLEAPTEFHSGHNVGAGTITSAGQGTGCCITCWGSCMGSSRDIGKYLS